MSPVAVLSDQVVLITIAVAATEKQQENAADQKPKIANQDQTGVNLYEGNWPKTRL